MLGTLHARQPNLVVYGTSRPRADGCFGRIPYAGVGAMSRNPVGASWRLGNAIDPTSVMKITQRGWRPGHGRRGGSCQVTSGLRLRLPSWSAPFSPWAHAATRGPEDTTREYLDAVANGDGKRACALMTGDYRCQARSKTDPFAPAEY